MDLSRITTRDVLAVMVVLAALIFNGISLVAGLGADAGTMTLAGAVVGFYFRNPSAGVEEDKTPLDEPFVGDPD